MKFIIVSIFLVLGSLTFAQDSLILRTHHYLYEELKACGQSENQLLFLNSVIARTRTQLPTYKENGVRFFRIQAEKLAVLHINAGWLCRYRGNEDIAQTYFSKANEYVELLKSHDLYKSDFNNTLIVYDIIQTNSCADMYRKDSTTFHQWDCAKFFPELNEETAVSDSIEEIVKTDSIIKQIKPDISHYGEIYQNDTLRFDPRFVLDSNSENYFERIRHSILSELRKNGLPEGMRLLKYDKADTIIIEINSYFDTNVVRKSAIIISFTSIL